MNGIPWLVGVGGCCAHPVGRIGWVCQNSAGVFSEYRLYSGAYAFLGLRAGGTSKIL